LTLLTPGRYCAFMLDLSNHSRNDITPRMIFEELRKRSSDDFAFTNYHWRRSGDFLLQVHSTTSTSTLETRISEAVNRVSGAKPNRRYTAIFRNFTTLQAIVEYARDNAAPPLSESKVATRMAAVFVEPREDCSMPAPWPKELDRRVEVLGMVAGDPRTLVALYQRPRKGGEFDYIVSAVKLFFAYSGIVVKSTVRALSEVDDIVSERLRE
jgi:hypothetical protein